MKFLIDVNASGALVGWLAKVGHDVVRVGDTDPRMVDEEILRWAMEEGRIVVTTDKDFEEMIWQRGISHCGILRLENLPRDERKMLLEDVLQRHHQDLASGAIVIAEKRKFRIRRR
jgi:predicted nuclease of predicted toxin-antitoxin system